MKKIIAIFLIWRAALFLIAAYAPSFIPIFAARFPYYQERLIETKLPHAIWSFGNFDGVHYLGIAQSGYFAQFTQAFFPLYPLLVNSLSSILISNFFEVKASLLVSALVISNVAFLAALIIFYKLTRKTFNENTALWACIFLLAFPTSFFFGAVYTESLLLLLVVSAYYLVEKDKIIYASVLGLLGSATRLIGVFLALTLSFKSKLKPLLIIPLGLIAYSLYLQLKFNNFLYFLSAQSAFGQERNTSTIIPLPQVIFRYLKILLTTNGLGTLNAALELFFSIGAILILIFGFKIKKIKREWLTFSLLAIIAPTLTGTLASMPRYILIAFPIYIVLASIKNIYFKIVILIVSASLLFAATAFFSQGYWVA